MAVRSYSASALGGIPVAGGDSWRNFMPSLLVAQLLFWLLLGSLYVSFTTSGVPPQTKLLQQQRDKADANAVKINELASGIPGSDKRGWIMSPLHAAAEHGLGGATKCIDVHVGTIGPLKSRANHRHHVKNESFLIWGAHSKWRIQNDDLPSGYAEVEFKDYDVSVLTAPVGRGHALINLDKSRTLYLVVCADTEWDPAHPDTDYHVWADL